MEYLLDSNVVISVLNGKNLAVAKSLRRRKPGQIGVSAIVIHELFYGAFKSARITQNLISVDSLRFEILEFNREDARHAGELRAQLARQGKPIGPYDILIAGQAMSRNLILVTHNTKEFGRVKGLRVETWD